jgi:hypothetical protein
MTDAIITGILVGALILAAVDEFVAQGKSLLAWAVLLVIVVLLWVRLA